MKLTHPCPKCKKPAKIQAEFPLGNFINFVYQCGHVELRPKISTIDQELSTGIPERNSKELQEMLRFEIPEPTFADLTCELENWYSEGGAVHWNEKIIDDTQLQIENMLNESGVDLDTDFQKNWIHPS